MATGPNDHPFYRPLWRRVAIVASTVLWFAFEAFYVVDPLWMPIAGGVALYCVWTFLISWKGAA